jgi:tetratricopeptide (TPR) repeat protein
MNTRWLHALPFVFVLTTAIPAWAKELWEQPWLEARSPHFVIVSAISEGQTVDLARELEDFREAVQIVTNIGRFEERIPTTLYVLPRRVEELGFTANVGAYFMPLMRANYAVVAPWSAPTAAPNAYCTDSQPRRSRYEPAVPQSCMWTRPNAGSGLELDRLMKHEYVHFLVHNHGGLNYAPWFDEGYAEMLATLTVRGPVIEYGQATPDRISWLQYAKWMSFASLLETRNVVALNSENNGKFYVQSWLLLHYLMNGRTERDFEKDNAAFIDLTEAGVRPTDAFERAFGVKVARLDLSLARYWKRLRLNRVTLAQPLPEVTVQVVPVAADSIAAQLGVLMLQFQKTDEAKRYWDAAIALNPNNVTALVGLGDVHKLAGRFDDAQRYYEKAIAVEPENAHAELNYGEYLLARATTEVAEERTAQLLMEARRHFARSYGLDPNNPETLAMNGSSYLFPGQAVDKALQSLTASHEMLPSQPDIKLLLATAYLKAGDRTDAIDLLRSLVTWSHGKTGEAANKLLHKLAPTEPEDRGAAETTTVTD